MGERLEMLMKSEGLNAVRLAEIIGVQRSGISHILSGRNKPGFDFLVSMLQRFPNVNPDWLLLGKGTMYKSDLSEVSQITTAENQIVELSAEPNLFKPFDSPINEQPKPPTKNLKPEQCIENIVPEKMVTQGEVERVMLFMRDGTFVCYNPK